MSQSLWSEVDRQLEAWLVPDDAVLAHVLRSADAWGLPQIHVSPLQGRWLMTLAMSISARRVLEIGTLAGYSAICLARALPSDGHLTTLELDGDRASLAAENLAAAGLAERVTVVEGPALASLERLKRGEAAPFDLIFIDADKALCADYVVAAVSLSRPGTVIIVDNVVREGRVIDGESHDSSVEGVRRMMELVARHPRLVASAVQTVGAKGYDGFLMAVVRDPLRAGI